jgi:hypothetical protein
VQCPFQNSGTLGPQACDNRLDMCGDLRIPIFMQHLIQRPLAHHLVARRCTGVVEGIVIMEFDGQVYRKDVAEPYENKCPTCGSRVDLRDRYAYAVQEACKSVGRMVNARVRVLLTEALTKLETP